MEEFNCINGLESINQLIGNIQLKRNEHEQLSVAVAKIRARLVECDRLESVAEYPE